MTAGPHGCGRDMYIFMRPEMVNGKVCFVLVLFTDIRCYMAHAIRLVTHAIGLMSALSPDHLHSDNCSVISPGFHLLVLTSPSQLHEQRGLDSSPLEHSGHISRKWMNRDMLMYAHVCVQYVPIKE